LRIFGLWILTATICPFLSLAAWTCPKEAEAKGVFSKTLNNFSGVVPNSFI